MDVFGTSFLPNTLFVSRLLNAKNPIIDLGEHFIKQTHRNRTFILSSNGPLPIIIPLRKNDSKRVLDIEISYTEDWQIKAIRSIQSAYRNSPYYEHYQLEFEDVFMKQETLLHVYNRNLIEWILGELGIDRSIKESTTYIEVGIDKDFRHFDFYSKEAMDLPTKSYKQVFIHKTNFVPHISVIDLLFNKGPEALAYLQ